jgi:hypothetical protein
MGTRNRILAGDDHFLYAKSNGYIEEYRRFFYSDIQSIDIYKTREQIIYGIILSFLPLIVIIIFSYIFKTNGFDMNVAWTGAIILALSIIPFIVNIFKGTTAKVLIRTFSSEDTVIFTGRYKSSVRMLDRMLPYIESVQGNFGKKEESVVN